MNIFRASSGELRVGTEVLDCIQRYRQVERWMPEAGGMLLGRRMESGDIWIDRATEPSPADKKSRFRFLRAREPAQVAVNAAWKGSRGEVNYLGEWHTHPEPSPTPSRLDICNWKGIIRNAVFEGDSLLFLIGGIDELVIWEVSRKNREVCMLGRFPYS